MLEATKSRESTPETGAAALPVNPALAAEAKIARIAVTVFPVSYTHLTLPTKA